MLKELGIGEDINLNKKDNSEIASLIFSSVLKDTKSIVFAKDENFKFICASNYFLKIVGVKNLSDLIGKTNDDIFSVKNCNKYREDDIKVFSTGKPICNIEETILGQDGNEYNLNISKYCLLDKNKKAIGIYAVGEDCTERKTMASRLNLIAESINGGLASIKIDGIKFEFLYYNEGFYNYSGYTRQEFNDILLHNALDLVFSEDVKNIYNAISRLRNGEEKNVVCEYRGHIKNGGYKWLKMSGTVTESFDSVIVVNVVHSDITKEKLAEEEIRRSHEEYKMAVSHGNNTIGRFYVNKRTLQMFPDGAQKLGIPEYSHDVPFLQINSGLVSIESKNDYLNFYQNIINGNKEVFGCFEILTQSGWEWYEAHASTVFDLDGNPDTAIISFQNISNQKSDETTYKKWKQTLRTNHITSYSIFKCNFNKNIAYDSYDGLLLNGKVSKDSNITFDDITKNYADNYVFEEDRQQYIDSMSYYYLLSNYNNGNLLSVMDYREKRELTKDYRWLRRTIELIKAPVSRDIMAYLIYEDIGTIKADELKNKMLSERDALTGIMNRRAFTDKFNEKLKNNNGKEILALLMFDIDNFKLVNDSFGHPEGDKTLKEVAEKIQKILRLDDLFARLGGDEFVVCLSKMRNKVDIANKAIEICETIKKSFTFEIQITSSIGIAIYPNDGNTFDELYKKSDVALYHIKINGKNSYAFYDSSMLEDGLEQAIDTFKIEANEKTVLKRRMLIVDDSKVGCEIMANIFKDDYIVEKVSSGKQALARLNQYKYGISIVLLDLMMPEMNGFEVLEHLKHDEALKKIPVVVVSAMDEKESSLRAIRLGASDYVTKPVDSELLKIRVESAISKAENERLKYENELYVQDKDDIEKYRAIAESERVSIMEYNDTTKQFIYGKTCSYYLFGKYDKRPLWKIFSSDEVTDEANIKLLQKYCDEILNSEDKSNINLTTSLKTPSGNKHLFKIKINKYHYKKNGGKGLLLVFFDLQA